ncbi:uncharacterized protein [Dysidea avara]|uniref:uncharacterized protein isoform X2 n=1 Tax=Dysidea avara TaxID=196820 RepID=UPI00332DB8D4
MMLKSLFSKSIMTPLKCGYYLSNSRRKTEEGHCTRRTELHSVIRLTEDNRTFDNSNQPAPLSHFNSSNNVGYQLVLTCTTNLEAMWTQQLYNMFHGHYEI